MELDLSRWDTDALAAAWAAARPFPWIVIDDVLPAAQLTELQMAVPQEPHWPEKSEIVEGLGSAATLQHPTLVAFAAALGAPAMLDAVRAISGKPVTRVDARSYIYMAGGYLLPHSDSGLGLRRQVAFTLYLTPAGTCAGGELELFRCTVADGDIVATEPVHRIEHRTNRLVLFDVSAVSLHQVCEVTDGARLSIAGWFS